MTGINGKKNKTEKSIVLFDKSIAVKEVKSILKDTNSSIISLDFESFELLQKNNNNRRTKRNWGNRICCCGYFMRKQYQKFCLKKNCFKR